MTGSKREASNISHIENEGLAERAIRSSAWAVMQTWGNHALSFLFSVFIIRLLGPEPIGLFALASVFLVFMHALAIDEFPRFLVQRKDVESAHLDAAFWVGLALNSTLAFINIALSGYFALWARQPLVKPVLCALSLNFIIASLGGVPQMLLFRTFEFKQLTITWLTATFFGGLAGVIMAISGFGVWSIVCQQVVMTLVALIGLWAGCKWRPRFLLSFPHAMDLIRFERNVVGSKVCGILGGRAADFIIGYFLGIAALGYYSLGGKLLFFMLQILNSSFYRVIFSFFSRLRDEAGKMADALYGIAQGLAFFNIPIFFCAIFLAPGLIRVIFGDKWLPAIPVVQILLAMGLIDAAYTLWRALTMVMGRPSWDFKINLINTLTTIAACLVAMRWGITGVALASTISFYLFLPLRFWAMQRLVPVKFTKYFQQYSEPFFGSIFMGLVILVLKRSLASQAVGPLQALAIYTTAGIASYIFFILLVSPHILRKLLSVSKMAFGIK